MTKKFNNPKQSLSYKQNLKSWKRGVKKKIINEASNEIARASRGGLILT